MYKRFFLNGRFPAICPTNWRKHNISDAIFWHFHVNRRYLEAFGCRSTPAIKVWTWKIAKTCEISVPGDEIGVRDGFLQEKSIMCERAACSECWAARGKKKKVPCCHLMYAYEAMSDDQIHCLSLYWYVQWLHPKMADIHKPDCRRSSLQQRCIHHNWCEISDCTGMHDDCMTKWPTVTTSTTMGVLHTVAAEVRTLHAAWNAIIPTLHIAPPTKEREIRFLHFTFFFFFLMF